MSLLRLARLLPPSKPVPLCSQCYGISLPATYSPLIFKRHRAGGNSKKKVTAVKRPRAPKAQTTVPVPSSPEDTLTLFRSHVRKWSMRPVLHSRLMSFGIPPDQVQPLLGAFIKQAHSGALMTPTMFDILDLGRTSSYLSDSPADPDVFADILDVICTGALFNWASLPDSQHLLSPYVSNSTISLISALRKSAERLHPAEEHPRSRQRHRTVIMHIGPTNSGKTHNALRALAASKTGVYCGPLRLLAHEIWERINLGEIVPAGTDPPLQTQPSDSPAASPGLLRRRMNPAFARKCNMVTGEERKIVEEDAPILSCTIEMLPIGKAYDVAVIDEIQLLADPQRGGSWSRAVLGLMARELHLCGDETAIPLVQKMLAATDDTLIIKRYERLTPLEVEDESLNGDMSKVQSGDCIVAFSRKSIFGLKRKIEEETSLRCAVVYGRLPPEIRSEQAALFNEPGTGYDVIVGSDAIGMGLNLKIRRIVFETLVKFDSSVMRPLSASLIKQIAGRAGRYGLHSSPGGKVTTLFPADLPLLKRALAQPLTPRKHVYLGLEVNYVAELVRHVPAPIPTQVIHDLHKYVARLPQWARAEQLSGGAQVQKMFNLIDEWSVGTSKSNDEKAEGGVQTSMTLKERLLLIQSPIAWRDDMHLEIVTELLKMYRDDLQVDFMAAIAGTKCLVTLHAVEESMKSFTSTPDIFTPVKNSSVNTLGTLETLHKTIVLYIWSALRSPGPWYALHDVSILKSRVERALEWVLKALTRDAPVDYSHEIPLGDLNAIDSKEQPVSVGLAAKVKKRGDIEYSNVRVRDIAPDSNVRSKGKVLPLIQGKSAAHTLASEGRHNAQP